MKPLALTDRPKWALGEHEEPLVLTESSNFCYLCSREAERVIDDTNESSNNDWNPVSTVILRKGKGEDRNFRMACSLSDQPYPYH